MVITHYYEDLLFTEIFLESLFPINYPFSHQSFQGSNINYLN